MTASLGLFVALFATAGTSSAFDGPNGHHQFVQFATHGAPLWGAEMRLIDANGNLVYEWSTDTKSGGKETWWFTANPGDKIQVYAGAMGYSPLSMEFPITEDSADGYCFLTPALFENMRYTGDSLTGGCTPD